MLKYSSKTGFMNKEKCEKFQKQKTAALFLLKACFKMSKLSLISKKSRLFNISDSSVVWKY